MMWALTCHNSLSSRSCAHSAKLSYDKNNYNQETVGTARGVPLSHYNSFAGAMSGL